MGKNRKVSTRVSPKHKIKAKKRCLPVVRRCAKCLERHEAPTGKKCNRLQTPGLQVGDDPLPGPPGFFRTSNSAESVSAEEVRLASARFPRGSSTSNSKSTPQRSSQRSTGHSLSPETDDDLEEEYDEGESEVFDSDPSPDSGGEVDESEDVSEDNDPEDEEEEEWEAASDADDNNNQPHPPSMQQFTRFTSQIMDRLERSERRTEELQRQLLRRQRDDSRSPRPGPRDESGRSPPPVQWRVDPATLQTPAHFTLPAPMVGPNTPPRAIPNRPSDDLQGQSSTKRGDRVWDKWSWDDTAGTRQPTPVSMEPRPEAAGQLPHGEKPEDIRGDPFLRMKVQSFLNRQGETEQPTSGRGTKSGLVRRATPHGVSSREASALRCSYPLGVCFRFSVVHPLYGTITPSDKHHDAPPIQFFVCGY